LGYGAPLVVQLRDGDIFDGDIFQQQHDDDDDDDKSI